MAHAFPTSQARELPQCQRDSSGKLLSSIKSLVRRPWQTSSPSRHSSPDNRPRTSYGSHTRKIGPTELDYDLPIRTTTPQYTRRESYPPPYLSNTPNQQQSNPRRGRRCQNPVVSMADYLTMAQLENVWQQQDMPRNNPVTTAPTFRPSPMRPSAEQRALPRTSQGATRSSNSSTSTSIQTPHQPLSDRDCHHTLRPGPISRNRLRINTDFSKPKSKPKSKPNKKASVTGWEWMNEWFIPGMKTNE